MCLKFVPASQNRAPTNKELNFISKYPSGKHSANDMHPLNFNISVERNEYEEI